jgi:PPK2 family polyphosphate:nucleotide phosphotransferase
MQDPAASFVDSPYLVPFDGEFRIERAQTGLPKDAPKKPEREVRLASAVERLAAMQTALYAEDKHAVLLVFQAMDAAGKDGTIKAVTSGLNPAGCMVQSFKQPSQEALDHDFLWRINARLPERGRIGVFNRSHYEEVLVVRVHPELLHYQRLPEAKPNAEFWEARYESIRDFERHLAKNGTVVVKFFLHVSKEEQRQRFLDRIADPEKNWKFSAHDVKERSHWEDYMQAYQAALNATSRPWAPWYAIPADSKSFMRMAVAEIVQATIQNLDLRFPKLAPEEEAEMHRLGRLLETEGG